MVSIDRVYQTVLTLLNKEGMGYITPQEFSLYANQAQIEIFERYFADAYRDGSKPDVSMMYMQDNSTEKLAIFNREDALIETESLSGVWRFEAPATTFGFGDAVFSREVADSEGRLPGAADYVSTTVDFLGTADATNLWNLGTAFDSVSSENIKLFVSVTSAVDPLDFEEFFGEYEVISVGGAKMVRTSLNIENLIPREITPGDVRYEAYKLVSLFSGDLNINEVDRTKVSYMLRSPLTAPSASQPVFHRVNETGGPLGDVRVYPQLNGVTAYYIRKPIDVIWTVLNTDRVNFELHASEFPELVIMVLGYAGVTLNRAEIAQFANQEEVQNYQTNQ